MKINEQFKVSFGVFSGFTFSLGLYKKRAEGYTPGSFKSNQFISELIS